MSSPSFPDLLQAAADQYAAGKVAAATASTQQQLATVQSQLASTQTQLANALAADQADKAADVADKATITQLQQQIASLQAQLVALAPGKAPAPASGWAVAFQDDFNSPVLDTGKWTATTDAAGNELSQRLPANVQPGTDHLSIVAKRQTYGTRQFTSGYITTAGKASWQFFRAMVRARCTDSYGLWPAPGWFRFDNAIGEIDAAEMIGTVRTVVQSVHQSNQGTGDHSGLDWPMPTGWSMADWHTYEVERQKDGTVIWRIDGTETFRAAPTGLSTQMHQPMTWLAPTAPEFTGPAHLNINLQVGGTMPKAYLGATYDPSKILPGIATASLDIDWVQVLTPLAAS